MEEPILLQELETLAEKLRVEVRYDAFEGRGGLCRYGGKTCLILNDELTVSERVEAFCRALARLPIDEIFIRPQVRERIEKIATRPDVKPT